MIAHSIYDLATGRIDRVVTCPAEFVSLQFDPATHGAIAGEINGAAFYIENDAPVAIAARPSPAHQFDWTTKAWFDPRTLADRRALKWAEIKAARSAAEFGPFSWSGHIFDGDRLSAQRIASAVQMARISQAAGQAWAIDWTLADNTVISLTAEEMVQVGLALGWHVNSVHEYARGLRAAIEAAQSTTELDAISWQYGA